MAVSQTWETLVKPAVRVHTFTDTVVAPLPSQVVSLVVSKSWSPTRPRYVPDNLSRQLNADRIVMLAQRKPCCCLSMPLHVGADSLGGISPSVACAVRESF